MTVHTLQLLTILLLELFTVECASTVRACVAVDGCIKLQ